VGETRRRYRHLPARRVFQPGAGYALKEERYNALEAIGLAWLSRAGSGSGIVTWRRCRVSKREIGCRAAGASHGQEVPQELMRETIRSTGRTPAQRSTTYALLRVFGGESEALQQAFASSLHGGMS